MQVEYKKFNEEYILSTHDVLFKAVKDTTVTICSNIAKNFCRGITTHEEALKAIDETFEEFLKLNMEPSCNPGVWK